MEPQSLWIISQIMGLCLLDEKLSLAETLLAKHAYKTFLALLGVESKAYHADNGHFADKGF